MLRMVLVGTTALYLMACSAKEESTVNAMDAGSHEAAAQAPASVAAFYNPVGLPGMAQIENKGVVLQSAVWPNPVIAVCWENPSPADQIERGWVQDAVARSWGNGPRVRFFGWQNRCAANSTGIRVKIEEDGPHTKGLGTQINGVRDGMVLNFTFAAWSPSCASSAQNRESCIRSIAVHEFGHALAFAHEQNRHDTPGDCTEKPQGTNGDVYLTPWDLDSVMNYCNPVYNNQGRLSAGDIVSRQKVYGG